MSRQEERERKNLFFAMINIILTQSCEEWNPDSGARARQLEFEVAVSLSSSCLLTPVSCLLIVIDSAKLTAYDRVSSVGRSNCKAPRLLSRKPVA